MKLPKTIQKSMQTIWKSNDFEIQFSGKKKSIN